MSLKSKHLKEKYHKVTSVMTLTPFDESTELGRAHERYRKVVLSTGSSLLYKGVSVSTGLISIPLTVDYLGTERFGMWMTLTSILALMTFADLGLGNGLVNAISKSKGNSNISMAEKAISSVFFMMLFMS